MGRPSRYPDEFRHEAVQMALASGESRASVARRLGVNETTLRNWVANHLAEEARQANPLSVSPSEFEELRRLRREVEELRVEKEILRKAAAYFAQETIRSPLLMRRRSPSRLWRQAALPSPRRLPLGFLCLHRPAGLAAAGSRHRAGHDNRGDLRAVPPHLRGASGARRASAHRGDSSRGLELITQRRPGAVS